eukprot:5088344-Pyramimonas_sp.AAC.2
MSREFSSTLVNSPPPTIKTPARLAIRTSNSRFWSGSTFLISAIRDTDFTRASSSCSQQRAKSVLCQRQEGRLQAWGSRGRRLHPSRAPLRDGPCPMTSWHMAAPRLSALCSRANREGRNAFVASPSVQPRVLMGVSSVDGSVEV